MGLKIHKDSIGLGRTWPRTNEHLPVSNLLQTDMSEMDADYQRMSLAPKVITFMAVILAVKPVIRRHRATSPRPHGGYRFGRAPNRSIGRKQADQRPENPSLSTICSKIRSLKKMGPPSAQINSNISSICHMSTTGASKLLWLRKTTN